MYLRLDVPVDQVLCVQVLDALHQMTKDAPRVCNVAVAQAAAQDPLIARIQPVRERLAAQLYGRRRRHFSRGAQRPALVAKAPARSTARRPPLAHLHLDEERDPQ